MIKSHVITDMLEIPIRYFSEKYWEYQDTDIRKWASGSIAFVGIATVISIGYVVYTWDEMYANKSE